MRVHQAFFSVFALLLLAFLGLLVLFSRQHASEASASSLRSGQQRFVRDQHKPDTAFERSLRQAMESLDARELDAMLKGASREELESRLVVPARYLLRKLREDAAKAQSLGTPADKAKAQAASQLKNSALGSSRARTNSQDLPPLDRPRTVAADKSNNPADKPSLSPSGRVPGHRTAQQPPQQQRQQRQSAFSSKQGAPTDLSAAAGGGKASSLPADVASTIRSGDQQLVGNSELSATSGADSASNLTVSPYAHYRYPPDSFPIAVVACDRAHMLKGELICSVFFLLCCLPGSRPECQTLYFGAESLNSLLSLDGLGKDKITVYQAQLA